MRLHFLGSQIRGEYFGVAKKRIVRTRTKVLESRTWKLAPEIAIPGASTSSDIFRLILEYVDRCRKELRGRYVDSELPETVGRHLDWRRLWEESWKPRQ